MSSSYWAADAIATSMEAANDRRHAAAILTRAEQSHRGTIAQLSAALIALRKIEPDHALTYQVVLNVIDREGECTNTFHQAWRLNHEPEKILAALRVDFENRRIEKLSEVVAMAIKSKRRGWFWNRHDVFLFAGVAHLTMQYATAAKSRAINFLTNAKFGDDLNSLH